MKMPSASTRTVQRDGITFSFSDARIMVGASVADALCGYSFAATAPAPAFNVVPLDAHYLNKRKMKRFSCGRTWSTPN